MTSRSLFAVVVLSVLFHASASAQDTPAAHRWEIEVHGGGLTGSHPAQGVASLPETRPPFVVFGESVPTSPSWFFGPAAARLNQRLPFLGGFHAVDPVLTTASAHRQHGGEVGFKVSRRIGSRLGVEVSVDQSRGRIALDRQALESIEASRASFVTLFRAFPFMRSVNATTSIRERAGREIVSTASLAIDLTRGGRVIPFASIGAGMRSRLGDTPGITLRGEYVEGGAITPPPGIPLFGIAQSDTLDVRYALADHAFVAVAGGGIRYAISGRWVARLEARGYFSRNSLNVSLNANPTTGSANPGVVGGSSVVFFGSGGPSIRLQFNTDPSVPQSLAGPPVRDFVTFAGRGVQSRVGITAGLGWRF